MMLIIEVALILSGLITIVTSLFYYYRRTQEKPAIGPIVRGKLELDGREFLFNRIGLYLLAMGVMIRYVNQIFLG
jgi:hypothetical protein